MTSRREQFRAIFLATVMVVSMVAMGATALAGSAAADPEADFSEGDISAGFTTGLDNAELIAGSGDQATNVFVIEDGGTDGAIDGTTTIELPENVSFSDGLDEDDIQTSKNSEADFTFTDVTIVDDQTLEVEIDGPTSHDDQLRLKGLEFDTTPDLGSDDEDVNIDVFLGDVDEQVFDPQKPSLDDDDDSSVGADSSGEGLETLTVETADATDGLSEANSQIAEGEDVIFTIEDEGLEFANVDDISIEGGSDAGNIEEDDISAEANELFLPVSESFESGQSVHVENIQVDVDADVPDETELSMTTEAEASTGSVEADETHTIAISKPELTIFGSDEVTLGAGINGQEIAEPDDDFVVEITNQEGVIAENTNITLATNNSDVTFDERQEITIYDNDESEVSADYDVVIEDNVLTFNVTDSPPADGESLFIADASDEESLDFNTSADIDDETSVDIELQTGETGEVTSVDENALISVEKADVEVGQSFGEFDEIPVEDADAHGSIIGNPGNGDDAITVVPAEISDDDAVQVADGTNITFEFPTDSEITFDTRNAIDEDTGERVDFTYWEVVVDGPEDEPELGSDDVTFQEVSDNELIVQADGDFSTNDELTVAPFGLLNVTAEADDVDMSVTYNTTTEADGGNDVTTTSDVDTVDVMADDITGDAGESPENVVAGETEVGTVEVTNETYGPFGGADVSLELTESPGDLDAGDVLNTTSLETAGFDFENPGYGTAPFEFSGTLAGDYTVNATLETDNGEEHVDLEYTVTAGAPDEISVDLEENAIRGGTSYDSTNEEFTREHRVAAYNVSIFDEFGSLTEKDDEPFEFELTTAGSAKVIADDIDDGQPTGVIQDENLGERITGNELGEEITDGHFYVFVDSTNSGTHDINLDVNPVEETAGIDRDDADATFYSFAEEGNIELETDSIAEDETTNVSANLVDENDDVIEVPRIGIDFEITNTSVASFTGDETADTEQDGLAEVEVIGDEIGETDIEATPEQDDLDEFDVDAATATLSVVDDEADFQITEFDDVEITEGDEATVDVEVTNEGDAEGTQEVVVEVDGEDISATEEIEELSPDDSETVSLDLNTEDLDADDYDMTAMTDDDTANATLTVEEPVVELDVTLDDLTIDEGENTDIDVDVENTGDLDAEDVDVELDIDDGEITVDDTVDVDAGDTETVTFEDVETEDLDADEYDMEATATHDDDDASDTATLTIEEDDEGIPGFTAGIAALALLGAALLALRLRNEE
ncbi:surface glycoprotein [Salinarchaeum sp. IM2453]|uniref:surface glycoprotein n=1 Tax=Salinarchaeum sp. IM2453 TaxID=2862870 RepID=UPI001C84029A|nr:surface glycoprotein [Salinarchaeum sp. IM2453]QZA89737.1 surface glycoprotein [Salinarchaeum sp. IM2453]